MSEIIDALDQLEKEKGISKDLIMDAIEKSIHSACEKEFGKDTEYSVVMDRTTGDIKVFAHKLVVEEVYNSRTEMTVAEAKLIDPSYEIDDEVPVEITTKELGRIAAQKARSIIVQAIKEGERNVVFSHFACKERDIITGVVQRYVGENLSISLDEKTDVILNKSEMLPGEVYERGDRIKLYVVGVKPTPKGFKVIVSRTHPELVKRLFEQEVTEVADGTVEIKSIAREAGSRTKIAVWSNDENVDAVGACVGLNGSRVNAIVDDLKGEKIDIIEWNEDPAVYIKHALSPSKVIAVNVTAEKANVVVPDDQLSLAIGKEGQNACLAARLTGYKIDIKSESQARKLGLYSDEDNYDEDYADDYDDEYEEYDEDSYDEEYDSDSQGSYDEDNSEDTYSEDDKYEE